MYCLQWLIPVLLIPKPVPAGLLHNHVVFMVLYLTGFFLERKPCTICSLVFLAAVTVLCYSGIGNCLLWPTSSAKVTLGRQARCVRGVDDRAAGLRGGRGLPGCCTCHVILARAYVSHLSTCHHL
ncbi:Bladder cancer-associated protein [Chionoecetes opilio]|uniref:Bladder cancer-associated protein n=1 Tax=Chionoecetes opilio TaxID=41210 RepID=A0A8J4YB43_CHIOP|nr:Bladder cancer-associated protein [Chionoecetes opilio]